MKILLSLMLSFYILPTLNSYTHWEYKDYELTTYKNFRNDKRINQEIDIANPDIPLMNALLFFLTNEERNKNALQPIEYHHACEIAAYNHSTEMVRRNFFSHTNAKDKNRKSTKDRAKLAGISNPYIAENISYIYFYKGMTYLKIAEKTFKNWMNSEGHKKNILSPKALQMGCGVAIQNDRVYSTQVFQWFYKIEEQTAKDKLPKLKNGKIPAIKKENKDNK